MIKVRFFAAMALITGSLFHVWEGAIKLLLRPFDKYTFEVWGVKQLDDLVFSCTDYFYQKLLAEGFDVCLGVSHYCLRYTLFHPRKYLETQNYFWKTEPNDFPSMDDYEGWDRYWEEKDKIAKAARKARPWYLK